MEATVRRGPDDKTGLLAQLAALRAENRELQRKLAEAKAAKRDREFQLAAAIEKITN